MQQVNSYGAVLVNRLLHQTVELYCGDSGTQMNFSDYSSTNKSTIVGKIKEVVGDCLILEVNGIDVYLNVWTIKGAVATTQGFIKDVFCDEGANFNRRYGSKHSG